MRRTKSTKLASAVRLSAMCIAVLAFAVPTATSNAVNQPNFSIDGIAVIWSADVAGGPPIASDFIVGGGGSSSDLIAVDGHTVVTGTLDPLDEAFPDGAGATLRIQNVANGGNQTTQQGDRFTSGDETLNAFQLNANTDVRTIRTDIRSSFFVATNVPFNIDVVASTIGDPADLNRIRLRMRMTRTGNDGGVSFGTSAQLPHTGNSTASGMQWNSFRRLSALTSNSDIFRGDRATALSPGTLADQSVRFDLDYRWNTGNIDLSDGTFDVEADVVYTVYIP